MRAGSRAVLVMLAALAAHVSSAETAATPPAWPRTSQQLETLAARIPPSPGLTRVAVPAGSFAEWLRALPLRSAGSKVHLFDGRERPSQAPVRAVVDIDVGSHDLQQCADAIIRLRAEYLWAQGWADRVAFRFTDGTRARWFDWREGWRPVEAGGHISWHHPAAPDSSYSSFREYLNSVFTYAGSRSLERQLSPVADPRQVEPGDVFVHGGSPGHAVLVVDVACDARGRRMFLLAQSYMPAQDIHVLRNPARADDAWYPALAAGSLRTPEWTFDYRELRRFPDDDGSSR